MMTGRVMRLGIQLLEQLNTAQPGHFVVSDHKIVAVSIKCLPGDCAIFDGIHVVARANQHSGIELEDVQIVLHHENTVGGFVGH